MKSTSSIKAKFERYNASYRFTKLYDQITISEKEIIENNLELIESEEAIIYFFKNSSYWWILTNIRLIICNNNEFEYIHLSDIIEIDIRSNLEDSNQKFNSNNIKLNLKIGSDVNIIVEDNTWHIIYNILKYASN